MPGKFDALKKFLQKRIDEGKKDNPDRAPMKRYISMVGDVTEFIIDRDMESFPDLGEKPWMEWETTEFQELTVPGSGHVKVFKDIEFE